MQQPVRIAIAHADADEEASVPKSQQRPSERPRPLRLRAVILQYDRVKYAGSVERLIALLDSLQDVEWTLVIVDNAEPGRAEQRVTGRLTYVGGDNRAWEFSAFDRVVAMPIPAGEQPDAWLFVTDAYQAYGDDFLSLVDRRAVELCVKHGACVGWVDSYPKPVELLGNAYQDWLRTSFVFVPHAALSKVLPFAAELNEAAIFGKDASQPFAPGAPLSENLRTYLVEWLTQSNGQTQNLEEAWHSALELNDKTFPKFRAKACAILREHLLSARIRRCGLPVYDFRMIPALETSISAGDTALLRRWEWSAGEHVATSSPRQLPTVHHIDDLELPASLAQGDRALLHIRGWALSDPPAEAVRVELGSHESVLLPFTIARPDVLKDHPEYGSELCGFEARVSLSTLPVGEHELALIIGRTAERRPLRRIRTLPKCSFEPKRIWIPEYFSDAGTTPIAIEGRLESAIDVERVEVVVDGHTLEPSPRLVEQARDATYRYAIHFAANVALDVSRVQHELELRFVCKDATRLWTHRFLTRGARALACTIAEARFGPCGQNPPFVPLRLAGTLYEAQVGDVLALERDGHVLLKRPISTSSEFSRVWFDIETDSAEIPPGIGHFALMVERGDRRLCVWEQTVLVGYAKPEITVDMLNVFRRHGSPIPELRVAGWVKNHFAVDHIAIEVDSDHRTVVSLNLLRPDVAAAFQSTLVLHQGFDTEVSLEGLEHGEHVVRIVASQQRGEQSAVTRRIYIEPAPAEHFQLASDDLERLLRGEGKRFCSSITIRGKANVRLDGGATAVLLIDERKADEMLLPRGEAIELYLRAVPSPGAHRLRVVVTRGETQLYDSGPVEIEFASIEPPAGAVKAVDAFLDRFDLRDRISGIGTTREIVRRLLEEDCERPYATASLLEDVGERLAKEDKHARARLARPAIRDGRPLRVLWVSWEVPCSRHGGGVLMANVIKHASRRHEITLLHGHGIDERDHVDEVRPYCRRVLSVQWASTDAPYCGDAKLSKNMVDEYIRDLRRTLEMEVLTGQYDIVNYEYSALLPYVVTVGPRVLYDHEVAYTSALNTSFNSMQHGRAAERHLRNALRAFHMSTVQIPDLFEHVIAVTENDATALLEFQTKSKVYLQQAGVDFEHFAARPPEAVTPEIQPTFVFVGNYRHNPNVEAVLFFARHVWPEVRQRLPTARFRIVGPYAPAAIQELASLPGVDVFGFVHDVRRALFGTTAFIAPIRTGTGMRLKVLEALAARLPVVGTELAMRGLGGEPGRHYLRADSASDFVEALVSLAKNPERAQAIANRGQALAELEHGWEARVKEREAIWRDVMADYQRH